MIVSKRVLGVLLPAIATCFARGFTYLPVVDYTLSHDPTPIETLLSIRSWGILWTSLGVLLVLSMFIPRLRIYGMSIFTGLLVMWGVGYLLTLQPTGTMTGLVTGLLFLFMSVWSGVLTAILECDQYG